MADDDQKTRVQLNVGPRPTFGKREKNGGGRQLQPWMVAIALVTVAIFAGAVWYAYRTGAKDSGPPPLVQADDGPIKVKPDEPGGLEVPDQDKLVYDQLAGEQTEEAEELLPAAEEPVADEPEVEQAVAAAVEAAPTPAAEAAPAVVETVSALDGQFLVQLAAYRERAAAERSWDSLTARYPRILAGYLRDIEVAEVAGKGTFYRLRAGPLNSRAEADRLCQALKDQGQDCLVKTP